jgi:hypothetical protein
MEELMAAQRCNESLLKLMLVVQAALENRKDLEIEFICVAQTNSE